MTQAPKRQQIFRSERALECRHIAGSENAPCLSTQRLESE